MSSLERLTLVRGFLNSLISFHSDGHTHGNIRLETVLLTENREILLGTYLKHKAPSPDLYTVAPASQSSDTFSAAVLVYMLLEGTWPWKTAHRVVRPVRLGSACHKVMPVLKRCWSAEGEERPRVSEILAQLN